MTRLKEINQKSNLLHQEKSEAKIISCQISKEKLISRLDDGREISIAVDLLIKKGVLGKNVKPEQLKKYELQNEGRYIYFSEIDEILPAWIISKGLSVSCLD